MTFICLPTANVHYGFYGQLQKGSPPVLTTGSIIATHYGKYGELLKGSDNQLMLDSNVIAGAVGKAEDAGDGGDGNTGDTEDAGDTVDKETDGGNEGRDYEDAEVVGDKVGIGGVSKDVEVGNDDMEDGVGNEENRYATVKDGKNSEDRVTRNNGVGDVAGNLENRRATIEDGEDFDDGVIIVVDPAMVDPTDADLTDVLAHLFGSWSPHSNSSPSVTAACLG